MTAELGRNSGGDDRGVDGFTAATGQTKAGEPSLMEAVVDRDNLWLAYRKVVGNRGAPGADGLPVERFAEWLKVHWPSVKAALINGQYLCRRLYAQ
jgi:RNA-directed DNA polymerase